MFFQAQLGDGWKVSFQLASGQLGGCNVGYKSVMESW